MKLPDFDKATVAPFSPETKVKPKTNEQTIQATPVTIFSELLGESLPVTWDDRSVTVGTVRYSLGEIAVMKRGMSPASIQALHKMKAVFEGSLVAAGKAEIPQKRRPYNPVECLYNGVKRDAHPDVCKWHRSVNDEQCLRCKS